MNGFKLGDNGKFLFGCGSSIILLFAIFAFAMVAAFRADRRATHYPGATLVSTNSNYRRLPRSYLWHDYYTTTDSFNAVFSWYSLEFQMGAESHANGGCARMETGDAWMMVKRNTSVFVCQTNENVAVFVNRATTFR